MPIFFLKELFPTTVPQVAALHVQQQYECGLGVVARLEVQADYLARAGLTLQGALGTIEFGENFGMLN